MKKKILLFVAFISLLLTGCSSGKNTYKTFIKKIENCKKYYLTGTLEIVNNEDIYIYKVEASYKNKDFYKVSLLNKTNDHEQIILKNTDGVYVLTPSLNKSFKFQSEWPYNNSQSYLLQSLINDIKNDKNRKVSYKNNQTIITVKANYSNNPKLIKEKIYLEKSLPKKVEVYDKDDNITIKMKFDNIDLKPKFSKSYFMIKTNDTSKVKETAKQIGDIVYPMNMPKNTFLASEDKINTDNGERVILTFSGDKPFTLVEETVSVSKELETINIVGEPELLIDTVGALSDNSITWISGDIEYYATSETLKENELLDIVKSINNIPVAKIK